MRARSAAQLQRALTMPRLLRCHACMHAWWRMGAHGPMRAVRCGVGQLPLAVCECAQTCSAAGACTHACMAAATCGLQGHMIMPVPQPRARRAVQAQACRTGAGAHVMSEHATRAACVRAKRAAPTMSRMLLMPICCKMLRTLVYSRQSSGRPSARLASTVSRPFS